MGALKPDDIKKALLLLGANDAGPRGPFEFPLDAATETFAILGRRGSGKTHTAVVMAEEMYAAGVQIVVLDPLDVWWGLRVSRAASLAAGLPIYVVGGSHGDLELQGDSGGLFADVVVDRRLSMVFSLRHLSKSDQRRFVADFCERLYQRKGTDATRTALHIFIDEADAFVPQRLVPGSERTFGAVDTLVRRGRASGLAPTLISQRPQVINKDVLSQTEVMICHQLTGPQDRKALQAWTDAHDPSNLSKTFMDSLASLKRGQCWVWSPGLLDVFARVNVRQRYTFDSSSTPKPGAIAAQPEPLTPVDLKALGDQIAATQQKAKDDDPVLLRRRIRELEEMRDVSGMITQRTIVTKRVLTERVPAALYAYVERVAQQLREAHESYTTFEQWLLKLENPVVVEQTDEPQPVAPPPIRALKVPEPEYHYKPRRGDNYSGVMAQALGDDDDFTPKESGGLSYGERRILTILAQFGSKEPVKRSLVSVHTGYTRSSRDRYLGTLIGQRFVERAGDGYVRITKDGLASIGSFEPLPTGRKLFEYRVGKLPFGEAKILRYLETFNAEKWVSRHAVSDHTGYTRSSRDRYIGTLLTRKLIEKAEGSIRLSPSLRG